MNDISVGDTVKIVNKVEKARGWKNSWVPEMTTVIGKYGTVNRINEYGYLIKVDNHEFGYPREALELVESCPTNNDIINAADKAGINIGSHDGSPYPTMEMLKNFVQHFLNDRA